MVLAASSALLAQPVLAADYTISGESNTFMRMKKSVTHEDLYPLTEYLRLSVVTEEKDGSATSLQLGAWGRLDLADRSTAERSDADLQYGYLSYRGAGNNLLLNAGRQFVTEGVATERIDGLYLRSDLAAGFTAAAFLGSPVVTEPNFEGGELIYGGRLSQGKPGLYAVGISALKTEGNGPRDREEQGVDFWIHPVRQMDLTGRSSYNTATSGWMEHAYTLSVAPLDRLTVSAHLSRVDYADYFYNVTTTALSLKNGVIGTLDPDEELTSAGVAASYSATKEVTVVADYTNYGYRVAGDADYLGGRVLLALPGSLNAGLSLHRMEGGSDRLRYTDYRLYALKKLGAADLACDFINIVFDRNINGVKSSFAMTGSAGYRFSEQLRVRADLEYSQSPDFDKEVRGLVKLAYAFGMNGSEGRGKSEK